MSLQDITIAVPSFLRHPMLGDCLRLLAEHLPEAKVIVADDSRTAPTVPSHVQLIAMPFDSGISAKRNAIAKAATTPYILLFSDDFAMDQEARRGVIRLLQTLEQNPGIDIAGGHVNGNAYEGWLTLKPGEYIKETRLRVENVQPFYPVELTVNYFLGKTEVLRQHPWDERMKIGGEHGQFFMGLKTAKKRVVWVPGVNINEMPPNASKQDPAYGQFRGRAWSLGHQVFLQRYNVKTHYGFDDPIPDPRVLVAVVACHAHRDRVQEQRATWIPKLAGMDHKFFYGRGDSGLLADETMLDVPDDYNSLPAKVKGIAAYALDHGYDYVFKVDTDTLVIPARLAKCGFERCDYMGRKNASPNGAYASGGPGVWLSRRALEMLNAAALTDDTAEDRWVGKVLREHNMPVTHNPLFILFPFYDEAHHQAFITACNVIPNLAADRHIRTRLQFGVRDMASQYARTGRLPRLLEIV